MRMPSHAAPGSFLFPAMLVSAFVSGGLHAQGFAGSAEFLAVSPLAAAPTASNTTLTPELLAKLAKLMTVHGFDSTTPAGYASALGFTAPGVPWENRQAAGRENDTGWQHNFAVSRGNDQDALVTLFHDHTITSFRARRDGTLVSAFSLDTTTKALAMRVPAEAQADFAVECAYWKSNVDSLIDSK